MNKTTRIILIGLGVILLLYILWYFQSIVAYVLIAAVISLIGKPIVDLLAKIKIWKILIPRSIAAFITLIAIWGIVASQWTTL